MFSGHQKAAGYRDVRPPKRALPGDESCTAEGCCCASVSLRTDEASPARGLSRTHAPQADIYASHMRFHHPRACILIVYCKSPRNPVAGCLSPALHSRLHPEQHAPSASCQARQYLFGLMRGVYPCSSIPPSQQGGLGDGIRRLYFGELVSFLCKLQLSVVVRLAGSLGQREANGRHV